MSPAPNDPKEIDRRKREAEAAAIPKAFEEYPKALYRLDGECVVVHSRDDEDELGDGWSETPPSS